MSPDLADGACVKIQGYPKAICAQLHCLLIRTMDIGMRGGSVEGAEGAEAHREAEEEPLSLRDDDGAGSSRAKLVVKVLEGKELLAADRSGTSDPYAVVEYGRSKKKTRTVKKDLNPAWHETFYFDFNAKVERVMIEVYDYDLFGSHDFLGRVEVSMGDMKLEAVVEDWFDLKVTLSYHAD
eukprot:723695-Hanusia_phi.AAC.2